MAPTRANRSTGPTGRKPTADSETPLTSDLDLLAEHRVVAGAEVDVVAFDREPVEEAPAGDGLEAGAVGVEVEILALETSSMLTPLWPTLAPR